ncbi:MAG: SDR family NAD(P)-dependent oxidoreductase [Acidobacteriota bacterium]
MTEVAPGCCNTPLMKLDGKVALVTGASRGIGRAIATALAREGAKVALGARSTGQLRQLSTAIEEEGGRALPLVLDVTDKSSIHRAVDEVTRGLGVIDILANNAGIASSAKTVEMDDAIWDEHIRVNLTGAYLVTKAVLPALIDKGWGRIINIASTAGKVGFLYTAAYCASKHGLLGFTRALALETARYRITVNAICPGFVATDMATRAAANIAEKTGISPEEALGRLAKLSPQQRLIEPEEVAQMAVMLASEEARGINGQAINIDGGAVFY